MSLRPWLLTFFAFSCSCRTPGRDLTTGPQPPKASAALRDPSTFTSISDPVQRSRALFLEASRVMLHARCVNCHPPDDSPRQGLEHVVHDPPVTRGEGGQGVVGVECRSCHQDQNLELAFVPGAPQWHLAPLEMAWLGKTPRQLCEQLKDPERNGHKTLAEIVEHAAHDPLVAWGWSPGHGREPAPGSQARYGKLMGAWLETGAACPSGDEK